MLVRILTGLVGIAFAFVMVFWPGGLPFAAAIGAISILGALEFYKGVRRIGIRPVEWAGLGAVALFVVAMRTYERSTIGAIFPAVLTVLLMLSFCQEMLRSKRSPLVNVGATLFGAIYVGWMISHLVVLHQIPGAVTVGSYTGTAGAFLVMFVFFGTWACDTGAYFFGRFLGKHKLAPNLSPNKTVEGAVAGLLCAVVVSAIFGWLIKLPMGHSLAMGAIFGVLTQIGDLSESSIKRELGIKDFGTIVPGHGGILDRFDSILFTGPAAYYYAVLFLQNWPR